MKPTAILINTARGGVVVEKDLIKALSKKEIWGAGLDVSDPEPMEKDNPLLSMKTTMVVPHIGSANTHTRGKMSELAAKNIIEFFANGSVPNIVNPQVLGAAKS